ncbi:hypothetical protein PBCV1_A060L [Paramecium bursaria Chlorella virus 1]|uniref:Uncharacterized protein n=1 Tax=Paramecium bursaria Chlorella virus 1 TaxID=10506 RepID=Q89395_PBCV1|nr:hypothetical protein PBCV1_A060L [Paramecium bursaria Chlorella virus 1]AAC96428.1 hypothetical protein [Paramecium bursaria Chlorella virus 1]
MKVFVVQADNRPDHPMVVATRSLNSRICNIKGWTYRFIDISPHIRDDESPIMTSWRVKADVVDELDPDTIVVYLDTDAWIQHTADLELLMQDLLDNGKDGAFSRDLYVKDHCIANCGSFFALASPYFKDILKEFVRRADANELIHGVEKTKAWYDMYLFQEYILKSPERFSIYIPDILNTPQGKVIRHNWMSQFKCSIPQEIECIHRLDDTQLVNQETSLPMDRSSIIDTVPFP